MGKVQFAFSIKKNTNTIYHTIFLSKYDVNMCLLYTAKTNGGTVTTFIKT